MERGRAQVIQLSPRISLISPPSPPLPPTLPTNKRAMPSLRTPISPSHPLPCPRFAPKAGSDCAAHSSAEPEGQEISRTEGSGEYPGKVVGESIRCGGWGEWGWCGPAGAIIRTRRAFAMVVEGESISTLEVSCTPCEPIAYLHSGSSTDPQRGGCKPDAPRVRIAVDGSHLSRGAGNILSVAVRCCGRRWKAQLFVPSLKVEPGGGNDRGGCLGGSCCSPLRPSQSGDSRSQKPAGASPRKRTRQSDGQK